MAPITAEEIEALAAAHEMRGWSAHYENLAEECERNADNLRDEIKRVEANGLTDIAAHMRRELRDTEAAATRHHETAESFWQTAMELEE